MNTNPLVLFLAVALSAVAPMRAAAATADSPATTIAFSRPDAPRTLRVETMNGEVTVIGADVRDVTVRASGESAPANARREDGLRVIASSGAFNLTERDNTVSLSQDAGALFHGGSAFEVTVPRETAVFIKIGIHGDATVRDLSGDIEISNLNGTVTLENVGGGVAVDTMNGEITARYAALREGKTHAFSSMNGQIRLFVPAAAKASLRLRAQNGTVATDFDEKVLVTKTEAGPGGEFPGAGGIRAGMEAARSALEFAREIAQEAAAAGREAARYGRGAPGPEKPIEPGTAAPLPPKPPQVPHVPSFPAFGGQVVTGTLNGGGVEIRATTMNGEIQVREAK